MLSPTRNLRWTYTVPTPLGETHSTFVIDDEALRFESDDPLAGGSDVLRWNSIREGGTATMAGMGGRGAPDMPNWVPAQLEWLTLSRTAGGGKPFMRVLPLGTLRDAIVAEIRSRLQARWIGERVPLKEAQKKLDMTPSDWSTLKVVGLVLAVMASLVLLLVLLIFLLQPIISVPAGFILGGSIFRMGLRGLRDGIAVANTPSAKVGSAALGMVEIEGRAVTSNPSPAGVTGRPSVWWDVSVSLWYTDGENSGSWRPVATRYGGGRGVVDVEDDTGRLPIWLNGAVLLLKAQSWESHRDVLPPLGVALLEELGFPWHDNRRILVTEQCVETNTALYVLGTLDERRHLPESGQEQGLDRVAQLLRTGEWRRVLVGAVPGPARIIVAVVIGYLDMLTKVGTGGQRVKRAEEEVPPSMDPAALVVWKGRGGRPFLVSNQLESAALDTLRKRSLLLSGVGAAVLCYTLYQLVELLVGK